MHMEHPPPSGQSSPELDDEPLEPESESDAPEEAL